MKNQRPSNKIIISDDGNYTAYFPGVKAAVLTATDSSTIFETPRDGVQVTVKDMAEPPKVVPWGEGNMLPSNLRDKVEKLPQMTSNLMFNIIATYGDGIKPVKIEWKDDKQVITPYTGNAEVKQFFEDNDIQGYFLEQCTDLHWFFNVFPEVIFNKENDEKRKIVEIVHKEAFFSRWAEMNKETGLIEWHYYFSKWGTATPDETENICYATPVLGSRNPVRQLRQIMENDKDKNWDKRRNSFIIPINFPTPGRNYYQKPYWYSLIESKWYDFAIKIPEFKEAIMRNQSVIKYIVYLAPGYFEEISKREKITDEKEKLARVKKEFVDINNFLKDAENAGKSIITYDLKTLDPQGKPYPAIRIEAVRNEFKGGEYLEDSEEVSNIIAYGMLVHPSLVGATPGKNKNISGTEARELFIIKQAIFKPFRDRILKPFYLIKAINKWPDDLHFVIPNIELTTLDKDKTGSTTKLNKPNEA